jgi:hypothetical protein
MPLLPLIILFIFKEWMNSPSMNGRPRFSTLSKKTVSSSPGESVSKRKPWNVHRVKRIAYLKDVFPLSSAQGYIPARTILLDHLMPAQGWDPEDAARCRNRFVEAEQMTERIKMVVKITTKFEAHIGLFTFLSFLYFRELWTSI